MKKKMGSIIIPILVLSTLLTVFQTNAYPFDYSRYSSLLKNYVKTDRYINGVKLNVVDYRGLYREKQDTSSNYSQLLMQLSAFNPASLSNRNEKIAFWINAYNIGAIKMILDNYPVDSIRSIKISIFKNPWKKNIISIGGRMYSLHQIEHDILLGSYRELRAHFAIVCASVSCPELAPTEYTGNNLNSLIESQAVKMFRSSSKGIRIDRISNIVHVSRIFNFDKKNFSRGKADIIPFILPYIEKEKDRDYLKNSNYEIDFLPYNWKLNSP